MSAINEALTRESRGLSKFTGRDKDESPIVRMEQPGGGAGYRPNKRDNNNPIKVDGMNGAEVKFDENTEKPFTEFPVD